MCSHSNYSKSLQHPTGPDHKSGTENKVFQYNSNRLLFLLLNIFNFIVKILQINKKVNIPILTRPKTYTTQYTSIQVEQVFGMEVKELYIKFFTICITYILCTYLPPETKKSLTELKLENQVFISSSIITYAHLLYTVLPYCFYLTFLVLISCYTIPTCAFVFIYTFTRMHMRENMQFFSEIM